MGCLAEQWRTGRRGRVADDRVGHAPAVVLLTHADAPADGGVLAGRCRGRRRLGAADVDDGRLVCGGSSNGVQGALLLAPWDCGLTGGSLRQNVT